MINFNEIHGFFFDFQATLLLLFVIASFASELKKTLVFYCLVGWFCFCRFNFYNNSRIKGKQLPLLLFHQEYSHSSIHYNQSTYLHTYATNPFSDKNPDGKRWLTASKLIKESEKHIYWYFDFYAVFVVHVCMRQYEKSKK